MIATATKNATDTNDDADDDEYEPDEDGDDYSNTNKMIVINVLYSPVHIK